MTEIWREFEQKKKGISYHTSTSFFLVLFLCYVINVCYFLKKYSGIRYGIYLKKKEEEGERTKMHHKIEVFEPKG